MYMDFTFYCKEHLNLYDQPRSGIMWQDYYLNIRKETSCYAGLAPLGNMLNNSINHGSARRWGSSRCHSPGGLTTLPVFSTQCTFASLRVDNETILARSTRVIILLLHFLWCCQTVPRVTTIRRWLFIRSITARTDARLN